MPTLKTLLPCPLQAILGTLPAVSRTDHLSQSTMPHNIPNLLTSLGAPCSDGPRQCLPCPQPTYPLLHGSQKAWIPFRQTHTCMQHASPRDPVHSSRTRLAHPASHSLQQVLSHQLLLDRDSLTANPLHTLCLWPLAHQQSHCLRLGMGQLSQQTFGPVHRHRALPEATDLLSLHPSCL